MLANIKINSLIHINPCLNKFYYKLKETSVSPQHSPTIATQT